MKNAVLTLTPNQRLAKFLALSQTSVWPLQAWFEHLYQQWEEPDKPRWLTVCEEHVLWERIIRASSFGQRLLKISATAQLAREAWRLQHQWRLARIDNHSHSLDTRAFEQWSDAFRTQCEQEHWIDSILVVDRLLHVLQQGNLVLPKTLQLVAFEEITPQWREFFEAAEQQGTHVNLFDPIRKPGAVVTQAAEDPEDEVRQAANQVKLWLQQESTACISVVVPDLEQRREQIVSIFQDVLPNTTVNVSAPLPLSNYPIIQAAFQALECLVEPLDFALLSRFIRSNFFLSDPDPIIRAKIELVLRSFGYADFSMSELVRFFSDERTKEKVGELEALNVYQNFFARAPKPWEKKTGSAWAEEFSVSLQWLSWPGGQDLSTDEASVFTQWESCLEEFVSMDSVLGQMSYAEALLRLRALAQERRFLPPTNPTSVHVLGLLEAAGLTFDYCWVMGLGQYAWPMPPKPNPFLSLSQQRQQQVPRSSAKRELTMAKKLTQRFIRCAKSVVFSYPTLVEGQASGISPLLKNLPERESAKSLVVENEQTTLAFAPNFDEQGPPVKMGSLIRGGTRVLQLQALCPFWSFAENRLQATPMPTHSLGLSAMERGEILHQVLEQFWEGLSDQNALNALTEEALMMRITNVSQHVLSRWQKALGKRFSDHYRELEEHRVIRLIHRVIALEKTRPYFSILATEQEREITFAGLQFRLRVDRIDKLSNGKVLLIDYKTGKVSIQGWFGARPTDPQLPLYCITDNDQPMGCAFVVCHPDQLRMMGVASEELSSDLKSISKVQGLQWCEQVEIWQETLAELSQEFIKGTATVEPIEGTKTCRRCHLKTLCRVHSVC